MSKFVAGLGIGVAIASSIIDAGCVSTQPVITHLGSEEMAATARNYFAKDAEEGVKMLIDSGVDTKLTMTLVGPKASNLTIFYPSKDGELIFTPQEIANLVKYIEKSDDKNEFDPAGTQVIFVINSTKYARIAYTVKVFGGFTSIGFVNLKAGDDHISALATEICQAQLNTILPIIQIQNLFKQEPSEPEASESNGSQPEVPEPNASESAVVQSGVLYQEVSCNKLGIAVNAVTKGKSYEAYLNEVNYIQKKLDEDPNAGLKYPNDPKVYKIELLPFTPEQYLDLQKTMQKESGGVMTPQEFIVERAMQVLTIGRNLSNERRDFVSKYLLSRMQSNSRRIDRTKYSSAIAWVMSLGREALEHDAYV